jgi:hypothetical protein
MSVALVLSFSTPGMTADGAGAAQDASEFERGILNLSITRAVPDPDSPWAIQNIDVSGIAGVVVGENQVLTLATNISRAAYIQAQKVDDFEKIPMRVLFADFDANLALLGPDEGKSLSGVRVMPVGPDIPIGSDVSLVAIENEKQLQRVSMRAMEVSLREAVVSGISVPMYSLSGQNRAQCKSDPVIRRGMLAGLCSVVVDGQPQAVSAGIIAHFLHDHMNSAAYRGFAGLGLAFQAVKSPWHRKILGVPAGKGALRVSQIMETSPFNQCVEIDDVVTALDDVKVDHRGFYKHPQWGSVPVRNYVASKYAGDSLTVRLIRRGKAMTCVRPLRRYSSLDQPVPGIQNEGAVPYVIFGGLVLRELNADYLMTYGRDWIKNAPSDFAFIYSYLNYPSLARKRVIILSNVLGDTFNLGFEKLSNLVLSQVNGQDVSGIEDLKLKLKLPGIQKSGVEFARFDFKNGALVALPYNGVDEAHKRMAKVYGITEPSAFFAR